MCWILNIIMLLLYGHETWTCYDCIDECKTVKEKRKYQVRLVIATVAFVVGLMALYKLYGVNDLTLNDYIILGKTR